MVESAERADPPADEAAEEDRREDDSKAPDQAPVEGPGGKRGGDGGQRVGLQEDPGGKEQEQREEHCLGKPAEPGECSVAHGRKAQSSTHRHPMITPE